MSASKEDLGYSPGLEGIVAGETVICKIDVEREDMFYRGYSIKEIAEKASWEEVAYLLLYDKLPDAKELADYRNKIGSRRDLPGPLVDFLKGIPPETPSMDIMRTCTSALAHFDPLANKNDRESMQEQATTLVAKLPVIIAVWDAIRNKRAIPEPDPKASIAEDLLRMTTGKTDWPEGARALEVSLILYAEHEFNASTFAARVIASTLSDLYSAATGGVGALKGPLHGGANERALELIQKFKDPDDAEKGILGMLERKEKIMGFGHRVLRGGDSRSHITKIWAKKLADQVGSNLYDISERIDQVMDREKGLFPNLDFYMATVYHVLGFPVDTFTPIFVASRITGWSANVIEQLSKNRIIRPRSLYTGPDPRPWPQATGKA
jgi:2-methylcitrate synthase